MRKMKKKGLSLLVSYVLLVGLVVTMAGLVYGFLRHYVENPLPEEYCPDGVSIIIADYNCYDTILNLTVKNKGTFNIDGYIVRVDDGTAGKPFFVIKNNLDGGDGPALKPGRTKTTKFYKSHYATITEISLQPFRLSEEIPVYCDKAIVSQKINCG